MPVLELSKLEVEEELSSWVIKLQEYLQTHGKPGVNYKVIRMFCNERKVFLPKIKLTIHTVETIYSFSYDFFLSSDYKLISTLSGVLDGLLQEGAYIKRAEKTKYVSNFKAAVDWLMTEAKRGQQIQRYKGLGEMNPEQLWETTMDPKVRHMVVVKIEDAVAADAMFTTLMGDDVEARRDFIEANALLAVNIDV